MLEKIPFGNSNVLTIFDKDQVSNSDFGVGNSPDVALLSSWEQSSSGYSQLQPLVEKLLDSGCKYFVCAGAHSEALHDFIDDVILDRSIDNEPDESNVVMTTWHDDDTNEEVAEFFFNASSLNNAHLVAFLEKGRLDDDKLKAALSELV